MNLRRATPEQFAGVCSALEGAGLPFGDLTRAKLEHFLTESSGDSVALCAGVEIFEDAGLLRSIVVAEGQRSAGLGGQLLAAIEDYARECGVHTLYLLTTTAAPFFARHGYGVIERDRAPAALRATAEFAALCPASAICMTKDLAKHFV